MPKKAPRSKSQDPITGHWQSPNGLWFNHLDPSGLKIGDTILLTLDNGKSKTKNFVGVCTIDDNGGSNGNKMQYYDLYADLNKNGLTDKTDPLQGPFAIYTYRFISTPIKSGTFVKTAYNGVVYVALSSPDANFTDPPGTVGYGVVPTVGKDYFV